MNAEEEFEALERLYKLTQTDGYGLSKSPSNTLDVNERLVLKKLLDVAMNKALKAHSKMMIARLESLSSVSTSQMLQPNDSSKEQTVPQENISTESGDNESFVTASEGGESFGIDPDSDQRRNLEQPIIQNVDTSSPEYLNKCCRLCKKSSIKKLESFNSGKLRNIEQEPKPDTDVGRTDDCGVDIPNKPKDIDCLAIEASETIKEIELCISTLQLGADQHCLIEKRSFPHKDAVTGTNSGNPCPRTQPGSLLHVESSQSNVSKDQGTHEVISEELCFPCDILSSVNLAQHINGTLHPETQQFTRKVGQTWRSSMPDELREHTEERHIGNVNQNTGHTGKAMIARTVPGKWKTSCNNFETRETPNTKHLIYAPSKMRSPDSPIASTSNKRRGNVILPLHKPSKSSEMKWMRRNANFPDWRAQGTNRPSSASRKATALNKNIKNETESTASFSSYSSRTSSQQNSSDGEEYSLTRRTRRLRSVTPRTSTNSEASPLTSEIDSKYSSSTRSGDDEVYSSTSNGSRELTSSNDSKTKEYSTDKKSITSWNQKPVTVTNRTQKKSRIWKSLKDRLLAIVFHHHHHHHHHIKPDGHFKVKSFFPRRKAKAYGEKAVDKRMKSVVHDKKQQINFHHIMEAVLRHVRHSKKLKSEDKKVPLDKFQHGKKKLSQKSQWLKVLQHHKRGKLPSKARFKIGVGTKKPRLKALPTIK